MATKMTAVEITERINKAQENLNKLMNLIAKREAKLEKLNAQIAKMDKKADQNAYQEMQWAIEDTEYALTENRDKIPEKEKNIRYWQEKLEKVNAENKKIMQMPKQLKELYEQVKTELIKSNKEFRDAVRKDYRRYANKEITWEEMKKKYNRTNWHEIKEQTDEEIVKEATKDAKTYILDLVSRVENKVGQITNWELYINGNHLNGMVTGTKAKAKVETIIAGGYNIQCLHNRVLVNRIK